MNIQHDLSSEIDRRLDFGMNVLDERDERMSIQDIEVSIATHKHRISDDLSEEDSNSVSLNEKTVKRSL